MDSIQLPADATERRRIQNRIAQRKFRQKKQLERIADRISNGQSERIPHTNDDHAAQADKSFEASDLLLDIADTVSPVEARKSRTDPQLEDFSLDLETMDNILDNYNPFDPIDAPLFPFPTSTDTTHPLVLGSGSVPDVAAQYRPSPRERNTQDKDGSLGHATCLAVHAFHESNPTGKEKGWLGTVHIAAQKGHERILRVLLEQGKTDLNSTDSDGRTPLFHAVIGGHESVVRLLLSNGARIAHLDCDQRSALHWAAHYKQLEVLRILLEHWMEHEIESYDINACDDHGWNPLHLAVERGFEEGVLLLIQYGADTNLRARKCWLTDRVIPFDLSQLIPQG
ncbi:ankyrin repeat-containing domain protein [Aspergillus californicus]